MLQRASVCEVLANLLSSQVSCQGDLPGSVGPILCASIMRGSSRLLGGDLLGLIGVTQGQRGEAAGACKRTRERGNVRCKAGACHSPAPSWLPSVGDGGFGREWEDV